MRQPEVPNIWRAAVTVAPAGPHRLLLKTPRTSTLRRYFVSRRLRHSGLRLRATPNSIFSTHRIRGALVVLSLLNRSSGVSKGIRNITGVPRFSRIASL